ncbi:hypothetical protein [Leptospira alstonii]|uniref:Uncharacterized protein n=1 Tax=Leptospira alstonii serovar Sichuan str. 79601 TaxID=1218565 RepID=M6DAI5_9LEPT|nr:hypothetical protein [Leptospira alstonii]AGS80547.1 hypothetical protein LEP1GSC193_0761 [Leptospira phage vB_LalZ_80412-LE1]EMJ95530.1 hypothetical protein LEP1GSC194_3561 [Leptospira alstonii serovar Sichuan str. 79601]
MQKKIKAKEILKLHPDSVEAKGLEERLEKCVVVEKNFFRITNQAFFLGLFFLFIGLYTLKSFPEAKISEGFGGVSVCGLFLTSGIILMSWFKTGEILKAVGDFISKAKGGSG